MTPVFVGARLITESQEYPALYNHPLDYFLSPYERNAFDGAYFVNGNVEPDSQGYYLPHTRVVYLYPESAIRMRVTSMIQDGDDFQMRHFFSGLHRYSNDTLLERIAFPGLFVNSVLVVGCGDHIELWEPDDFPDAEHRL